MSTQPLPTVTVEDVLSWRPCYLEGADGEAKVRALAAPLGERFNALAVLRAQHITSADRLWTVLREEMVEAPVLHEFACRSAEWALVLVALGGANVDPRSFDGLEVKRRWLRGEATDKELDAARSAADAAWIAARIAARSAADAAWIATWIAARSAAWIAAWIAADAARSAARSAAWIAADAADDLRIVDLIALLETEP